MRVVLQVFIVSMVASLDLMFSWGPPPRVDAPTALMLPPLVLASAEMPAEVAASPKQKAPPAAASGQSPAAKPRPCAGPRHREFDFWIGNWEVVAPDGRPLGANRIEVILDGCVLAEHWSGAGGSSGRSLSLYEAARDRWHQTWVDSGGRLLSLEGGMLDGSMVLAKDHQRDGRRSRDEVRWTRLADDSVRQHWRRSEDGGCTWNDVFVGIYKRRP